MKWPAERREPITIKDLKSNAVSIKLDEEFESNDPNWLRQVSFRITNTSEKPITYIAINLNFPETANTGTGGVALHQITLGDWTFSSIVRQPFNLEPGESREISLETQYSEKISLLKLKQCSANQVTKIITRLNQVLFVDETLWSGGEFYRRNPDSSDRHKWITID
ncbi:MAG: hypothetical protein ABR555_02315 [Pyrinomonadaceae bacterium]